MKPVGYKLPLVLFAGLLLCACLARAQYNDPAVMMARSAAGTIAVDGRMNESDWSMAAPYLVFGPNARTNAISKSVTGGVEVRPSYADTSWATVKLLRKGLRLYIGIQSMDKSVGRFGDSWEGDGLFMKIKNAAAAEGEFKLYYNASARTAPSRDSAVYEIGGPFRPGFGNGVGLVNSGTIPYDTTQVDSGYTLELEIRLDSLGFAANIDTLQALMSIFDADGYHRGTLPWEGPPTRTFHKTWWGSEWGPVMRKIYLEPQRAFDDPAMLTAKAAIGDINVDGKMDESDWTTAKPYLKFGPNPPTTADEKTVTGGALVRGAYWDPSYATMKFLRKGPRLYIGIQSKDKSVGRFGDSWEGDGLFMKIKNAAGTEGEFKLYYNASDRTGASRDSAVYEPGGPFRSGFGRGIGLVASGTIPYDTTQVDSGYTLELEIKLDSLGFAANVDTLQVLTDIFDPDGYHRGSVPWEGPDSRSFHKTWWGSEWGPTMRKIYLEPQRAFDDPPVMTAKAAAGNINVDGKMDEAEWALAKPYLKFGPNPSVTADEKSVTGGALVRGTYWDPTFATVKLLRKGPRLYVGIQSKDKSVGRFGDSWEGDGLFMKIKNAAAAEGEFKLYYNASDRTAPSRDSAVYEIGGAFRPGFGKGVGLVASGTIPYDTTQVDSGYTLELEIKLDSLGFAASVDTVQVLMNIFDPDGYHRGTVPWVGPDSRSFHKTWWGSEWGPTMRKIYLEPQRAYDDPPVMTAKAAAGNINVDGKMDEAEWALAKPYLKFGPNPSVTTDEKSVTDGVLVRGTYWDPTFATVKLLRKGPRLYVGIQSKDKSVGRFGDSWEGDGLFMKIKNAAGTEGEFKLYYNASDRIGASRDSAVYEPGGPFRASFGRGVGLVASGTIPYDTTQVDSGYTLELEIKLDSLGFAASVDTVQVLMNIFEPDGYHRGTVPWEGPDSRSFHKTWWGSEWGPTMRKIYLEPQRAYDDPARLTANLASGTITIDGKMNEAGWALAKPYLKFGPNPSVTADERSVTDGVLVRGTNWDPSFATMKFLRNGLKLYIGIQSRDKSVGRFGDSWEGDGLFMKIKNAAGTEGEFKLYYNASDRTGASRDSAVYEIGGPFRLGFGRGVGLVNVGTIPYDTTQVDSGYTLELQVNLDSLGYAAAIDSVQVLMNIFDPDGYHRGTVPWVGPDSRSFHKTWWGSEWGPAMRWLKLGLTVDVTTKEGLPTVFALSQNYPNPFNPSTTINFDVPEQARVSLVVYDIIGREVATLVNGDYTAGYHRVTFSANNLASGVYFYRMTSAGTDGQNFVQTKKLLLMK